jgi:sterol desaturase/sphingolipid hydroxylase (fatty acid hydroxylase superfamily)
MQLKKLPTWLSSSLVFGTFGLLLWLEQRRPLRPAVESKLRRNLRNLTVAAVSAIAIRIGEKPVTGLLTNLVERRRLGLLKQMRLPKAIEALLAVVLMDYTLYVWHVLTHRVPLLWRLHRPHHVDLDLSASTALRFHFTELIMSVPWRAGQIILIGISPFSLSMWQTLLALSIIFHHSNVRLSIETERWLNRFIVTPRMHGIHHSIVPEETNSNWSSGLTIWDWLHGTLRLNVPQDEITIGIPAYRNPKEATLTEVLKMPFGKQRSTWQLPDNGQPVREQIAIPKNRLLD